MKETYCEWHDRPTRDVTEIQREECEEYGLDCRTCEYWGEREREELPE